MRVTIVDMSGIFRAAWHSSTDKPVSYAHDHTIARVREYARAADRVVVACDRGRSFRHDLSKAYKAHRVTPDAQMVEQMRRTEEVLARDGFAVIGVNEYEADDVIATIATQCEACGVSVLIHSADKDLLALVSDLVHVRSTATGKLWTPEAVAADTKAEAREARGWGVRPDQMRDLLALAGDASDGVPGVAGVGAETASKLLRTFGDLNRIASVARDAEPDGPILKGKMRENIREAATGWPDAGPLALSRQLVTLRRDVPLEAYGGLDGVLARREPQPQRPDFAASAPPDDGDDDLLDEEDASPEPRAKPVVAPSVSSGANHGTLPAGDASSPSGKASDGGGPASHREETPGPATSSAIVVAPPAEIVDWSRMIEPRTPQGAHWLATQMFESRLFSGYGNNGAQSPEACLALIYAGRELGIGAVASLRGLNIIRGKVSMAAMLMVGLCLSRGAAEYFELETSSPEAATWVTKRRGRERVHRVTYTIQQAKDAGLYPGKRGERNEPTMWEKDTENMLVQRAASRLARRVYPDVLMGAAYTTEELSDDA